MHGNLSTARGNQFGAIAEGFTWQCGTQQDFKANVRHNASNVSETA